MIISNFAMAFSFVALPNPSDPPCAKIDRRDMAGYCDFPGAPYRPSTPPCRSRLRVAVEPRLSERGKTSVSSARPTKILPLPIKEWAWARFRSSANACSHSAMPCAARLVEYVDHSQVQMCARKVEEDRRQGFGELQLRPPRRPA